MTTEYILAELTKGFDGTRKAFLLEAFRTIFNRDIPNPKCSNCLHDAYMEMRYYLKKQGLMKPTSQKYELLLPNVWIMGMLSHEMTDEQIEKYVQNDPKNSKFYFKLKEKEAEKKAEKADKPTD